MSDLPHLSPRVVGEPYRHGAVPREAGSASGDARPATTGADRIYGALAPLVFGAVHLGARALGTDAAALRQRRGELPPCARPCLWLHGASAGEMAAAATLVALLREHGLRFAAAYTTTNRAGLDLIARRLADGDVGALAPWDVPRWVARALDGWRPAALVLIETELWPALIHAAARRGVPVLCASGRIYPRDVPRYRLVRRWLRPTLQRLDILAQDATERARFVALGADPTRCAVGGNLKQAARPPSPGEVANFRSAVGLGADERLWVAGSLHADEAELLAAACAGLPPALRRVVVAPRHASALPAFAAACAAHGLRVARRSRTPADWQVLLLDSMGELRTAYAAAALAVVGGGFAAHGGHDLAEPLRCGVPVLFGRRTEHVAADAAALRAATPAACVASADEMAARVAEWLSDAALRAATLERQRAALPDPLAVAAAYVAACGPWLSGSGGAAPATRASPSLTDPTT